MVIFGASGDLTKRKLMPALYNLASRQSAVRGVRPRWVSPRNGIRPTKSSATMITEEMQRVRHHRARPEAVEVVSRTDSLHRRRF